MQSYSALHIGGLINHPEIVKHTVEVQPSFDSQYFNSEGEMGYNSANQNNGDVFLDIIKQKEEIISQT